MKSIRASLVVVAASVCFAQISLQATDWKKIATAAVIAGFCNQITSDPAFVTIVSNDSTRAFAQGFGTCSLVGLGSESGMYAGSYSGNPVGVVTGFIGGSLLGGKIAVATGTSRDVSMKGKSIMNPLAKTVGCSCGLVTAHAIFNQ